MIMISILKSIIRFGIVTFIIINTCGCAGIIGTMVQESAVKKLPTYSETKEAWSEIPEGYGRVVVFYPRISSFQKILDYGGYAIPFKIGNIKGLFLFDQTFLFLDLPLGSHSIKFRGQIFGPKPILFEVIANEITFINIHNTDGLITIMKTKDAEPIISTIHHKYQLPLPFDKQPKIRNKLRYVNEMNRKICNPPCSNGMLCDSAGNCVLEKLIPMPSRKRRKIGISVETSWIGLVQGNELVGIGLMGTYRPFTHFSLDGRLDYNSIWGVKYGVHSRFCLLRTEITPFLGYGYERVSGADGFSNTINNTIVTFDLKPIGFQHISCGLEWLSSNGITLRFNIGLAAHIGEALQNVRYNGMTSEEFKNSPMFDHDANSWFWDNRKQLYLDASNFTLGVGYSF
jgi:hypothetical protein